MDSEHGHTINLTENIVYEEIGDRKEENSDTVSVDENISDNFNVARENNKFAKNSLPIISSKSLDLEPDETETITVDCIDQVSNLFTSFVDKPPTLGEALEYMGYNNSKGLAEKFARKAEEKLEILDDDAPGLTVEDVAMIICYSFEWKKKRFGDVSSPYRMLNDSLCVNRNNTTLKKTRRFMFLLLKALRKLPRSIAENKVLYRGIEFRVQTKFDPEFPQRLPYATGNEKTWWTFTSTTMDLETAQEFTGRESKGTLFVLSGETWGYNIRMFSDFPSEKEVLLEPERRLKITSVSGDGQNIIVDANILDTPLVLEDVIKVTTSVETKAKMNTIKEVPQNFKVVNAAGSTVELSWSPVVVVGKKVVYQVSVTMEFFELFEKKIDDKKLFKTRSTRYIIENLKKSTDYIFMVRCGYDNEWGKWSEEITIKAKEEILSWKKCPDYVDLERKYSIDKSSIATKDTKLGYCTIIGNIPLLHNKVTPWEIKISRSRRNDGNDIFIGVAPFDINQNEDNYDKCGWYFHCFDSTLHSGLPHNYSGKEYGPRKEDGQYVHGLSTVGVIMDTTKGDLSFVLGGINLGVAYEGIPLDKPLVPCSIFYYEDDCIELSDFKIEDNINKRIPVPSNIITTNITWDSITFTWTDVTGAEFYQIEVDGSDFLEIVTTNTFTKRGLFPGTIHNFKVRTVKKEMENWHDLMDVEVNKTSEWSDAIKAKTAKSPKFSGCVWKDCPNDGNEKRKYSIDVNDPRIVSMSCQQCTIIGNAPLTLNNLVSWNIKILNSKDNDGNGVYIGIAPSNINQSYVDNHINCGWYYYCYNSTLWSGPLHYYGNKEYGPKKGKGKHAHTGDTIGVVMDTIGGELSFILNGVNYGVAYEGIPLDKPLVPCVLLYREGDSVEIDTSFKAKENINSSITVLSNVKTKSETWDSITLTWDTVEGASFYQIEVDGSKSWGASTTNTFIKRGLLPETEHSFRVRTVKGCSVSEWSDTWTVRTVRIPDFSESFWKECPDYIEDNKKYFVNENNPRIATKNGEDKYSTIIGNIPLPLNKVTSWNIKILNSKNNDGKDIYVGVTQFDIIRNDDNYNCRWYYDCYESALLWSEEVHEYWTVKYGPEKGNGKYVHNGDSVGVMIDTTLSELSFVLNGVNLGVIYEGIPLDKPLVPCVLLKEKGDSIELDTSEVKENEDNSILIPSNIIAKSDTWDSITLTWDAVEGVSFYQVEVDESKFWYATKSNTFIKKEFLPESEHSFRVRTVKDNKVKWSGVVKTRTQKVPNFTECVWKECPDYVEERKKYFVDKNNLKIATKSSDNFSLSIIVGNTPLPLNKVTSWNIKILNSKNNNGSGIHIGVAPFDINQNEVNKNDLGWYFDCCDSTLWSGPPHNYKDKEYGLRKENGEYVRTGDSVGVIMDTTIGELSFVLNGVNLGVAYDGIPLDKPLVPCVILLDEGDSVELGTSSEMKENVDSSIQVPSNIITKNKTWDSITLTWDAVDNASFYQVEMDGSKSWDDTTTNTFTKKGLLPETEHIFRMRIVKSESTNDLCGISKWGTTKESFKSSFWKKCPSYADYEKKYSVDEKNPRIGTKFGNGDDYCAIIWNTPLPFNKVISWNIKILRSGKNNGDSIFIGVAPTDIYQNESYNYDKCGWYFNCYSSTLWSGPPHNYYWKKYGPRKECGRYVYTGDSVGVVMDTTIAKDKLSFVVNGENYGVAYDGIPIDKPLVPCVLLRWKDDSVELILSDVKDNITKHDLWDPIVSLLYDDYGDDSFYQNEVHESNFGNALKRFLPESNHSLKKGTVKERYSVSKWSDALKTRTQKLPDFSECIWKDCTDFVVDPNIRYSVDEKNPRVAINISDKYYCTIIGNTSLPLNKITSWNTKILKSKDNDGEGIHVGVAPFDINQDRNDNYKKCGWHFYCYDSTLYSGRPHKYRGKEYGPRKGKGKCVHTRDNIGVMIDTIRGELSFILNGVNLGVAYEGIPLDKPLVPCVILLYRNDSIELII